MLTRRGALQVEIIGFDGCPNLDPTMRVVRDTAAALDVEVDIKLRLVTEHDDPEEHRFLGSPTVLINKTDIEPVARSRTDFGFGCRRYSSAGPPSTEMIESALREALAS